MSITWASTEDVAIALGIDPLGNDWLTQVTAAANEWAFRRRKSSGYVDVETTAPGPDVQTGTVLYAKALYTERGAVDGFASFEQFEGFVPTGGMGQVNRLLGIPRPAVA